LKTWWRRALPRALNRGQASARVVLSGWEAVIGLGTTPGRPPSWVAAMELPIHIFAPGARERRRRPPF
jgi:hypothetical protein